MHFPPSNGKPSKANNIPLHIFINKMKFYLGTCVWDYVMQHNDDPFHTMLRTCKQMWHYNSHTSYVENVNQPKYPMFEIK
jgi:hypothetical protein